MLGTSGQGCERRLPLKCCVACKQTYSIVALRIARYDFQPLFAAKPISDSFVNPTDIQIPLHIRPET